ncbi:MAG: isoaspartyl peptidase/L-asparaginase family protein [Vibrio sp.]
MTHPIAIAIHGGVGSVLSAQIDAPLRAEILTTLEQAVRTGHQLLVQGADALDAAVAAVTVLEDSPLFNAAKGSALTDNEMVEMDASVMHGAQRAVGMIARVRHIKNPIQLARDVLRDSPQAFLSGEGAEQFAFQQGHQYTEQDYFFTERCYDQLQSLKPQTDLALCDATEPFSPRQHLMAQQFGSVGAVALDQLGNLAAASSTGGVANQPVGRVGSAALMGAGTLAENGNVAISCTGTDQYLLRYSVASDIAARMRYLQQDVQTACQSVLQGELKSLTSEVGLIAINACGDVHFATSGAVMYCASIDRHGQLSVNIYADQ